MVARFSPCYINMFYNEYANVLAFILYSVGGQRCPDFKEEEFQIISFGPFVMRSLKLIQTSMYLHNSLNIIQTHRIKFVLLVD